MNGQPDGVPGSTPSSAVPDREGPGNVPQTQEQELTWTELDQKAVDTARILAADAVEKVGNGHPGTAMSLAPAAYLLFHKLMRHDPSDPEWDRARPLRPLPRAHLAHPLHPALPVRVRPRAR
ncbi:hypothetical protein MN0502_16250 [Arthrobacter sp. MN05-02]|nr:hypothetical protein MN0502_16250 [Arthrobacter sp. MN05-02]